MAPDSDRMTFESLTSVYRVERGSGVLSKVDRGLYPAMLDLLDAQSRECDRLAALNPDSIMYDGAAERKKKIAQYMKKIVEIRMDKISALALRGAMGAVNAVDLLTPEEREFYDAVLEASKRQWSCIERRKRAAYIPDIAPEAEAAPEAAAPEAAGTAPGSEKAAPMATAAETADAGRDAPAAAPEAERPLTLKDMPMMPDEPMDGEDMAEEPAPVPEALAPEPEPEPQAPDQEAPASEPAPDADGPPEEGLVVVRVLEDLPTFSGPDVDYSLKRSDVVRMPAAMAAALVTRGKAVCVLPTP